MRAPAIRPRALWLLLLLCGPATAEPANGPRDALAELVAQAVRNHPSVAARRAESGAARFDTDAARAQYFPTPSLQVRQDKGEAATVLAVSQPLWAGGRLDAGLAAAQARAAAADAAIAEAQYALALRVAAAWQAWRQAQGRGAALAGSVELLNIYAQSVSRRIQGGASAEVDRELVAARLSQAQGDLAAARAAERSALAQLGQLAGRPLRAEELSLDAPAMAEATPPALDALIDQALARAPALRRIDADIATAHHEADQKRAALWPAVNLRAEHQRANAATGSLAANDSRVMVVLEYVPGAGLSAGANIDAAQARLGGLRETREAARRELIERISADFEDHLAARTRQRDAQRSIAASAEVLASYDRLFVAGKRSWLDVLNAARELVQAQMILADVDALLVAARYRLRVHAGEVPWLHGAGS